MKRFTEEEVYTLGEFLDEVDGCITSHVIAAFREPVGDRLEDFMAARELLKRKYHSSYRTQVETSDDPTEARDDILWAIFNGEYANTWDLINAELDNEIERRGW